MPPHGSSSVSVREAKLRVYSRLPDVRYRMRS